MSLIEIRLGGQVVVRTTTSSIEEIATLHIAAFRRFRQGRGFPASFVGFDDDVNREPAGHRTVWFHPSIPVVFDYGTSYEPVDVEETRIAHAIEQMDSSELGVIVARASVPTALRACG